MATLSRITAEGSALIFAARSLQGTAGMSYSEGGEPGQPGFPTPIAIIKHFWTPAFHRRYAMADRSPG
ncbi:MAG: hypothetical protein ABIL58_21595 [Pseudomonadota bacterium]